MSDTPDPPAALPPFEEVYVSNCDAIYAFCFSQLRDPVAAEDCGADVFVRAFQAYERKGPEPAKVRAWLYGIARNTIADHGRATARLRRLAVRLAGNRGTDLDVEEFAARNSDLLRAQQGLALMKPRERTLIGLRVAAGLPYAEIAEITGVTAHAAEVATHRALDKLRSMLEAQSA